MKRLVIALALLTMIFSLTLWNVRYLRDFTVEIIDLLTQAEELAEAGDWSQAHDLTVQARDQWEGRKSYLHITLIHSDTNEIYVGFREVLEFIRNEEGGEYSAANARLMARLELLNKMDELSIENIL